MANTPQHKIDSYLEKLRHGLRGMNDAAAHEIMEELRSHIADKATVNEKLTEPGVDAALAALGAPDTLAKEYLTAEVLARRQETRSPLRILDCLFCWASLSVGGLFALLGSLLGYSFGLLCLLSAVLKVVHPATAGIWLLPDSTGDTNLSVRLGFGPPPANGHELLGWWNVPIGLGLGFVSLLLTTSFARWFIRHSQTLPR